MATLRYRLLFVRLVFEDKFDWISDSFYCVTGFHIYMFKNPDLHSITLPLWGKKILICILYHYLCEGKKTTSIILHYTHVINLHFYWDINSWADMYFYIILMLYTVVNVSWYCFTLLDYCLLLAYVFILSWYVIIKLRETGTGSEVLIEPVCLIAILEKS